MSTTKETKERYESVLERLKSTIYAYRSQYLKSEEHAKHYTLLTGEGIENKKTKDMIKTRYGNAIRKQIKIEGGGRLSNKQLDDITTTIEKTLRKFGRESKVREDYGMEIKLTNESREVLERYTLELVEMIYDTAMNAQEKLEEFTHRNMEIMVRFAIHHAILCRRTEVIPEDLVYARSVYKPIWQDLIYNIEDLLITTQEQKAKRYNTINRSVELYKKMVATKDKNFVAEKVWIRRRSILMKLQEQWENCSYPTAHKRFSSIETNNPQDSNMNKHFLQKKIKSVLHVKLLRSEE